MEKYTKKATARIMQEVFKLNPKASKLTSFDQAFVILMDHWDLEMSIYTNVSKQTTCTLHRGDDKPKEWKFEDAWDSKAGDWDWNTIYKTVLEDIIKGKLYKRPKLGKRAQAKLEKEKAEAKAKEEKEALKKQKIEDASKRIEDLKKKKGNLQVKKSDWKKSGKDISGLVDEIEKINTEIKTLKKLL